MSLRDKIKEFVDFIDNPSEDNKDAKLLRLADQILYLVTFKNHGIQNFLSLLQLKIECFALKLT